MSENLCCEDCKWFWQNNDTENECEGQNIICHEFIKIKKEKEENMAELKIEVDVLNLENIKRAFVLANNAIYFNDRSDYLTTLYEICLTLNPDIEEELIGTKYIEE